MATPSLEGYRTSALAKMGDVNAQQKLMGETPGFNMLSTNTSAQVSNAPTTDMGLDREVEIGLGVSLPYPMSNREKQDYVDSLSNAQYRQMKKLKNQGYSFEASRAILENSDKLVNPTALGKEKYMPKETFGEKVEDFSVGVLQSPGKRGYNMIGQRMDRLGKRGAEQLEGTDLAKWVQDKAIDLFGEEEVRAYQQEVARQEAEGTLFNGREQTDIRTPLLGEQRANSKYTRAGEVVGDLATAAAMSYPMMVAAGPAYANSTLLGKTILGGTQGALDMAMYDYGTTGEAPSLGDMAMGATLGVVTPMLGAGVKALKGATKEGAISLSEKILQNTNRMTKAKQAEFASKYGVSAGKWLNDRGLRSGEDIVNYFTTSKNKVDEALASIKGRFTGEPLNDVLDDVVEFAQKTKNPNAERLMELSIKNKEGGLTMPEINEVKRFFEAHNKFNYLTKGTAVQAEKATNMDTALRERQFKIAEENGFSNLAELNKETAAAKEILNGVKKWEAGVAGNNPISLTDVIVAFGGGGLSAESMAMYILKKEWETPAVRSKIVDMLNWIGGHETMTEKVADLDKIMEINKIKDQKALEKYVDDLYKEWGVGDTTPTLPESVEGGVAAGEKGFVTTNPTSPTYQEMGLGDIKEVNLVDKVGGNNIKQTKSFMDKSDIGMPSQNPK